MYITANYELTRGEYMRARRAIGGWWRIIVYEWIPMPLGLCFGVYMSMRWMNGGGSVVPSILTLIVGVPVLIWIQALIAGRKARRSRIPVTMLLTTEAVEIQSSQGSHVRAWTSFVKTAATAEFWLLYTKKRYAVIVPRRAFLVEDQAEIDSFLRAAPVAGPT
jgi:YcxB-like protein